MRQTNRKRDWCERQSFVERSRRAGVRPETAYLRTINQREDAESDSTTHARFYS